MVLDSRLAGHHLDTQVFEAHTAGHPCGLISNFKIQNSDKQDISFQLKFMIDQINSCLFLNICHLNIMIVKIRHSHQL